MTTKIKTLAPQVARGIVQGTTSAVSNIIQTIPSVDTIRSAATSIRAATPNLPDFSSIPNIRLPRTSERLLQQQRRPGFAAPSTSRAAAAAAVADAPRETFLQRLDSILTDISDVVSDDREATIQNTVRREANDFAFGRQTAHQFLQRVWNRIRQFDTEAAANDVTINILGPIIELMGLDRRETLVNPKKGPSAPPKTLKSSEIAAPARRSIRQRLPTVFTSAGGGHHIVIDGQQIPLREDLFNYHYRYNGEEFTFPKRY